MRAFERRTRPKLSEEVTFIVKNASRVIRSSVDAIMGLPRGMLSLQAPYQRFQHLLRLPSLGMFNINSPNLLLQTPL